MSKHFEKYSLRVFYCRQHLQALERLSVLCRVSGMQLRLGDFLTYTRIHCWNITYSTEISVNGLGFGRFSLISLRTPHLRPSSSWTASSPRSPHSPPSPAPPPAGTSPTACCTAARTTADTEMLGLESPVNLYRGIPPPAVPPCPFSCPWKRRGRCRRRRRR